MAGGKNENQKLAVMGCLEMKRGEFFWWDDTERDKYRTMQSLIKFNAGKFKSDRQAAFIKHKWAELRSSFDLKEYFGVDIKDGSALVVFAEGIIQHSIYGGRSRIPYTVLYVLDNEGIVSSWRLHYNGNLAERAAPNPSRTELLWQRDSVMQTA